MDQHDFFFEDLETVSNKRKFVSRKLNDSHDNSDKVEFLYLNTLSQELLARFKKFL